MDPVGPLRAFRFLQVGRGPVVDRAARLLALLGAEVLVDVVDARARRTVATPAHHGVLDGEGTVAPGPGVVHVDPAGQGAVADGLRAAAAVVELLSDLGGTRVVVDGPQLATERAHLLSRAPTGTAATTTTTTTTGGAGRMVRAADRWVAVNLPRPDDLDLLDAWLGRPAGTDPWRSVEQAVARRQAVEVVADAQELGLAVARVVTAREAADDDQARARHQPFPMHPFLLDGRPPAPPPARVEGDAGGPATPPSTGPRRLAETHVVDLSSLWAGPLATSLLADAGAEVVKVESTGRPDGARRGDRAFFDLLNAGKRSVALDLPDPKAVAVLQALVDGADLVVEGSRPRALDQLGIVRHRRWVALTAYGASGPWRQWSGFGDDAAVAGGLVGGSPQAPAFYGDAIADPVAGLHAAVAGLAVLVGAPASVDLALREVVNHVIGVAPPGPMPAAGVRRVRPGRAPALGEAVPDGRGAGTQVAR